MHILVHAWHVYALLHIVTFRKDFCMNICKPRWLLSTLALVLAISVTFASILPVYATDNVDSLKQSTSDLENELSNLNQELKSIEKEIKSIRSQISEMSLRIEDTKTELAVAKGEEEAQYAAMKTRMIYMYENGSTNLFHILLESSSMADFLNRAELFSTITEYDRNALKELEQTRASISLREEQLAAEQQTLNALQSSLKEKANDINNKISQASSELSEQTTKLEAALEAARKAEEEAKRAEEEAKRAEEALKQEIKPVTPPKPSTPSKPSDSNSPAKPDVDYTATASDIELFAALIECEAGSRDYEGMLAVASVVVNRMNHRRYPDTLRGVIFQSGQFPPAHNGLVDRVLARGVKDSCVQAALDAIAGKYNVGDCLSVRAASSGLAGTIFGDNVFF